MCINYIGDLTGSFSTKKVFKFDKKNEIMEQILKVHQN